MLQYMRDKAASWIVIIFLGLIIFVFIFMGFGGGFDKDRSTAAEVNGVKISAMDVQKQYKNTIEQIRRFNKGFVITEDFQKRILDQAKQQLIQEELIIQEADRLGIDAVADTINYNYTNKAFLTDGKFDRAKYEKILDSQGMDAYEYENRLSRYLLQEKMRSFIVGEIKVSDEEILNRFIWEETRINADYVVFKPSDYSTPKYTDKDLSEYLMANKEKYRTKPMVKVEYVTINPSDYAKDFKISDKAIKQYYDSNPEEFLTPKTVAARHILIRTKNDGTAKDIESSKKKALNIYEKAKKTKNFAALAKKYSEGPTAKSGGFLGEFRKGTMVKEFDEKVFSMKEGEISEPVKTVYGWHIIKVDKINPEKVKSYDLAKISIEAKLLKNKIESKAYEIGDAIFEGVDNGDSLKDYAKTMKVKYKETPFFTKDSLAMNPKIKKEFVDTSFKLFEGEICEPKVINGIFYLIKKTGKKDSQIAKLSAVKEQVIKDYTASKKEEKALKAAQSFRKAVKDEKSFIDESKKLNKTILTAENIKRDQIIPKIGHNPVILKALFSLDQNKKVLTDVLTDVNGFFVFKLNKKLLPETKNLEGKKASIRQKLSSYKTQSAFSGWVEELKRNSEIKSLK